MANVCDSYCKDCMFSNTTGNGDICCNWYLATDIRRPCNAGTGCTVKKKGQKIGKWDYENNVKWMNAQKERKEKKRADKYGTCKWCGEVFVRDTHNKSYCSDECRLAGYHQRYLEKYEERNEKIRPSRAMPSKRMGCPICGVIFKTGRPEQVYCSKSCKNRAAYLRMRDNRIKHRSDKNEKAEPLPGEAGRNEEEVL